MAEPDDLELPWAPCMGYELEEESETPGEGASGAPVYSNLRWKKSELRVHFMNEVPARWNVAGSRAKIHLTKKKVLEWANGWSSAALGLNRMVPKFIMEDDVEDSEVRIKFVSGDTKTYVGTTATNYLGEETFWLDLSPQHDGYREYLVVHEFGHVLGLGHEHQMDHIAGALDKKATIAWLTNSCNMDGKHAKAKFKVDFEQFPRATAPEPGIEFDPRSVMCYPIAEVCIRDKGRFTHDDLKAITSLDYNRRKVLSRVDVETIKNLYK